MAQQDLIFDLGVNAGQDTEFYLHKGFRVVGVEANPQLYDVVAKRLASYVAAGQLTMLNIGVWSERSTLKFYVNLDNDDWSSFEASYGCRNGTRYEVIDVECVKIIDILNQYGVPRYIKIDVEGADKHVVADLKSVNELPQFISTEEYGVACVDALADLGYTGFKFAPQRDKSWAVPPNPPLEGLFVGRQFDGHYSGLFGQELPGDWMQYEAARKYFTERIRNEEGEWVAPKHEWYDVHAKLGSVR